MAIRLKTLNPGPADSMINIPSNVSVWFILTSGSAGATLDNLAAWLLGLDEFRISALERFLGGKTRAEE